MKKYVTKINQVINESNSIKSLVEGFEQYLTLETDALFEASNLAKTGMPKQMVSAIHQKEEHKADEYEKLGYVNRGKRPLVVPYKYFTPSHDIEVGAPLTFTGKKVPDPAGARKSMYPDFAQYLIDIPKGPIRVLITRPEDELYMYLYYKSERVGGEQYAILIWDKEKQNVADYGFVGLTLTGVEKHLVREVHKTKGGNTNQKIQEIVFQLTGGGPSNNKPVQVYEFEVKEEAKEPRGLRTERAKQGGVYEIPSLNVLEVFANKYLNVFNKLNPKAVDSLKRSINVSHPKATVSVPPNIEALANELGADPKKTFAFLFKKFADFRRDLFSAGREHLEGAQSAYLKTDGYELEKEQSFGYRELGVVSYYVPRTKDPLDLRPEEHHLPKERRKRELPTHGEVASIPSMIKHHSLDGLLHRFAWYTLTGKITAPSVSILATFGIKGGEQEGEDLGDFGSWTI